MMIDVGDQSVDLHRREMQVAEETEIDLWRPNEGMGGTTQLEAPQVGLVGSTAPRLIGAMAVRMFFGGVVTKQEAWEGDLRGARVRQRKDEAETQNVAGLLPPNLELTTEEMRGARNGPGWPRIQSPTTRQEERLGAHLHHEDQEVHKGLLDHQEPAEAGDRTSQHPNCFSALYFPGRLLVNRIHRQQHEPLRCECWAELDLAKMLQ
jgi:hypothetical protein